MPIPLILASGSPRRRELLSVAFSTFEVIPADIDETLPPGIPLVQGPEYLALQKARTVAARYPEALVIGSDTGVFIDGKMLGKPASREEGAGMLRELSGREHSVITGCALILGDHEHSFSEETLVRMYLLSEPEIQSYLDLGVYRDKAGSYAIQGKGALLIEGITGDYSNVVGFPIGRLVREIQAFLGQ